MFAEMRIALSSVKKLVRRYSIAIIHAMASRKRQPACLAYMKIV
jgi:hypothetical protein